MFGKIILSVAAGVWLCACTSPTDAYTTDIPTSTLSSAPDNGGLMVGTGFGWRKLSEPNAQGEVKLELMLPYHWTLMVERAHSPSQSTIFAFNEFDLRQRDNIVFRYPRDASQAGAIEVNLETTPYPCLIQRGTQVIILLAQQSSTKGAYNLSAIYCENGKFKKYFPNVEALANPHEELAHARGKAIFLQLVGE